MLLGELSKTAFLQQYWQKKPLLIRNALAIESSPISAEELAGLACEVDSSRIVQEHHPDGPWKASYGPFEDDDFTSLPETHWTVLVSDCEKHLPELRSLTEPFRFIPDWLSDDLMISYAADQGSVGPHYDHYDVFLLQLEGEREWQIGGQASGDECIPELELRILKDFTPTEKWILSPGDMLYLPPGVSHHGVAQGNCMTASIGFRALSHREILQAWMEDKVMQIPEDLWLRNSAETTPADPSEINRQTADNFRSIIDQHLKQSGDEFADWLGSYLSETGPYVVGADGQQEQDQFEAQLNQAETSISHTPYSRFSWQQPRDNEIVLSVNGRSWRLPSVLKEDISLLCQADSIQASQLKSLQDKKLITTLFTLYNNGAIELES